jgi:hypothetical protein
LIAAISENLMAAFFFDLLDFSPQKPCNFDPLTASHPWPCGIRGDKAITNR